MPESLPSNRHDDTGDIFPSAVLSNQYCPPLTLLRAYHESVLPSALSSDIAIHLSECPLCRTLLANLERVPKPALTSQERARIRSRLPMPSLHAANWRWYAASIAAVALAFVALFIVFRQPMPQQKHASHIAHATPPRTPTALPEPQLQIAKLALPAEFAPGFFLHGTHEAGTPQPAPEQLAPAFEAYGRNDYPLAAQRFSQLTSAFPFADIPLLYLGVTQLLLRQNTAALTTLTRANALAQGSRRDVAAWYHALAAVQVRAPEASELLHKLCRHKSRYTQQACKLQRNRVALSAN